VVIVNIEMNEKMEFAHPPSSFPVPAPGTVLISYEKYRPGSFVKSVSSMR